ncbi:NAD(P)/FAD-dependent oxidoreductase [Nesterenkonia salmonea]|uniref:NAD(P)/FAD-dependent oxidoreductase n=1 Tax=Nesterenkonia salmonea TaxID=1804987 RepID=A0A5R9B8E0_9MICC|nr:NAD(P)/FAD-dependent oxidoreductase [Nesterenkonia salmonea]TLP94258.1 NAD(P)/FAD-dependent oxidoreductase [Nesterenkonia salmonea]
MNTTEHVAAVTLLDLPIAAEAELWDSIIIGGGPAGLSAALSLGRSLRRTVIIDAGQPRNRFASHMHTVLGMEGIPPQDLLDRGRRELAEYGAILHQGSVRDVRESTNTSGPRSLIVSLDGGPQLRARTVIAASGLSDHLPDIPGLAKHWGKTVLHCPYCHGWEVRGQRLGVLAAGPMALHQAELLRQWSDRLTFFSAAAEPLDDAVARRLRARGVTIEPSPVVEALGTSEGISGLLLENGQRIGLDALFTAGRIQPHDSFLSTLDLKRTENPMGSFLTTDFTGRTSHERIWAPGNISNPAANVPLSISAGTFAGATANMALVSEDFDLAVAAQPLDSASAVK